MITEESKVCFGQTFHGGGVYSILVIHIDHLVGPVVDRYVMEKDSLIH